MTSSGHVRDTYVIVNVPKKLKWFGRLKWKAPQTKHT